ncbi:MAG: hypothetical protein K2P78_04540 [Gemmataceae bacterium]|nr:hypothetical protein [Gemmataceae bacterium]
MRLAAQVKGGYYPCHPDVVKLLAARIAYSDGAIVDPCAGEGEAVESLAQALGCPPEKVYLIELERERAEKCRQRLPAAHVLGPCSCFETRVTSGAFSVAWVNPPFDTNVHGGRAEAEFVKRATELLAPGGLIVLVIPAQYVGRLDDSEIPRLLLERYEQLGAMVFPKEHRPFNEVAIIGKKRRKAAVLEQCPDWLGAVKVAADIRECPFAWEAPALSGVPAHFEKAGLTEEELVEAVASSPLWNLTKAPPRKPVVRPPLPLSKGHVALLLASGQLDGVVHQPGEAPHVVRGTARKVACEPDVTTEVLESGAVKTVTTIKERIQLVIRAVGPDGNIRTFE